jgi:hypothetical protein
LKRSLSSAKSRKKSIIPQAKHRFYAHPFKSGTNPLLFGFDGKAPQLWLHKAAFPSSLSLAQRRFSLLSLLLFRRPDFFCLQKAPVITARVTIAKKKKNSRLPSKGTHRQTNWDKT